MLKEKYIQFKSALANRNNEEAEKHFREGFDKAIEIFNQKVIAKENLKMENEEELYATLFLFDNMIGLWAENLIDEAIQVANDMAILVDNPKIKEAFILFSLGMKEGIELNEFIREYVDLRKVDKEFPMFLVNFTDKIETLIQKNFKDEKDVE